jgi:hypothetical protein
MCRTSAQDSSPLAQIGSAASHDYCSAGRHTEEGADVEMRRKKRLQDMSIDELIEMAKHAEEMRQRRNARRRERRQWLKNAPREQTVLRYHAQERPCTVGQYLYVERFVLRWLDEFPGLRGDATAILLTLAHNILHLLHPAQPCTGTRLVDCPSFSLHELCSTGVEILLNYRLDPAFKLTRAQLFEAMAGLTQGLDPERLRFNSLLGDLPIDL